MDKDQVNKMKIGIAGAGIAGLRAGIHLLQSGFAVQIFEARSKAGGRIQSLLVDEYIIESGPEFIHGYGQETIRLLDKYGIPYVSADGKMYIARQGGFKENEEMIAGWDKLVSLMQTQPEDLPLGEFLEKKFPGKPFAELRARAIRFAEGFDLADPQSASTRALANEWAMGNSVSFRIPEGYHRLIDSMTDEFYSLGGQILFEHVVDSVIWYPGEIRLSVRGNPPCKMDRLIISLPLSILNQMAPINEQISFFPSLDPQYEALSQIGFGTAVKIMTIWDTPFWETIIPEVQYLFSDGFIPTWWTQYPLPTPVLAGWLGGPAAEKYSAETDAFFLEKALESLSMIFSTPVEVLQRRLKDFRVFNWKNIPWSRGAYSYSRVGAEQVRSLYRKSLEGRIYFTGEAFYDGPHPGTVEAAVVSGLESAKLLVAELK